MTPLANALLKKKAKAQSRSPDGCPINFKERINAIVTENRKSLASGKMGSEACWKKVDVLSKRKESRYPTQALTRTLWESLMIILQIYVTMEIIPDPYLWTSLKTFLHHGSHWARFTIRSAQNKANIYWPKLYTNLGMKENAAILAPAVHNKQSGTYPCQLKGGPVHGSKLMSIRYPKL